MSLKSLFILVMREWAFYLSVMCKKIIFQDPGLFSMNNEQHSEYFVKHWNNQSPVV